MLKIIPAYGRNYDTIDAALKDWKDGKDFKIEGGPYCSIRDLNTMVNDYDRVTLYIGTVQYTLGSTVWGDAL